jgi:lysozyme
MNIDRAGLEFLITLEALKLKPYLDTKKVPTIGIGSTFYENGERVKMTDRPITKEEAFHLFELTKGKYEKPINDRIKVPINQNQFNALFAFTYNVGPTGAANSDLFKYINAGASRAAIEKGFMNWKGKRLNKQGKPELLTRRQAEINKFYEKTD